MIIVNTSNSGNLEIYISIILKQRLGMNIQFNRAGIYIRVSNFTQRPLLRDRKDVQSGEDLFACALSAKKRTMLKATYQPRRHCLSNILVITCNCALSVENNSRCKYAYMCACVRIYYIISLHCQQDVNRTCQKWNIVPRLVHNFHSARRVSVVMVLYSCFRNLF